MFGHRFFGAAYYGPRYWGDGGGLVPPVVESNQKRGFAGFPRSPLWIAHINGKRYVGTFEELDAILGEVVEKTEKKPRIVVKPLRKAPEGASVSREVMAAPTMAEAKEVQEQLYMGIQPMLLAILQKRQRDEDDDMDALLMML